MQAIPDVLEDYPSTKFVFVGPDDDGFGEELVRQAVNERRRERSLPVRRTNI